MAEDWSIDVRKYAPSASSNVIDAIVRYCGIALQNRDSSLVSFSDNVEVGRVRENYLKKKLGLTNPDAELNAAIAAVGERMKGDRTKNRVTVYYLLAEHFRKLSIFGGEERVRAAPKAFAAEEAGVAAAATAGVVGLGDRIAERERPSTPPPVTPAHAARTGAAAAPAQSGGIKRWLPWLALAALLLLGWFLLQQRQAARVASAPTVAPAVAPAPSVAPPIAAPAPVAVLPATPPAATAPAVIAALPSVYFALGSAALSADERSAITTAADAIRGDGARVAITGFTDRTGNLTANEALAQRRAETVRDALVSAGVPAANIEMRPPAAVENGAMGAPDGEARRVEIARL